MSKKKYISVLFTLTLVLVCLCACQAAGTNQTGTEQTGQDSEVSQMKDRADAPADKGDTSSSSRPSETVFRKLLSRHQANRQVLIQYRLKRYQPNWQMLNRQVLIRLQLLP